MSSPPPLQQNPPNPRKRPSISSTASQQGMKRARMHPLRQTSFPASLDADPRVFSATSDAGSVTGSFTGSLGGASAATGEGVFAGAKAKKRGRKSKVEKEREREDATSTRAGTVDGTRTGSVDADGGSVRAGGGGGGDDGDDDEDFDDEGELLGGDEGPTDTEAEKKNLAILVDAFNPIQSARYDLFKRAKLRKETLRRIVNHALSQSVPASVVTTINGFTKVFAGEIIEKARTVQAEWAEAHDNAALAAFEAEEAAEEAKLAEAKAAEAAKAVSETASQSTPDPSKSREASATEEHKPNGMKQEPAERNGDTLPSSVPPHVPSPSAPPNGQYNPSSAPSSQGTAPATPNQEQIRPKREFKLPPNPHRGQLLPTHLREALRRYKRDCEGGGVGMSGLSLQNLGVSGAFTWSVGSGGRRLFR
ncbi:transcription initiation factor TFIID subunit beta [Paecilomyces variotii No. 5]|uniref:Transcription initiation factor TFIID subunit beta n=1 Tax=Byssochlamys spectabilis (strain No. 5 / NBRC 109023) TaxID=1356009 RepID=V5FGU6_BYSSN|nr:transcription initiation factor TFIID subunit beta [Paecilomyces variotii No. 5]